MKKVVTALTLSLSVLSVTPSFAIAAPTNQQAVQKSLNADMNELLEIVKFVKSDADIENNYSNKSFDIEVANSLKFSGYGKMPINIDYYEVYFSYKSDAHINVSAALAKMIALHLGGIDKGSQIEKAIVNLQNEAAKKIKKSKTGNITVSKKVLGLNLTLELLPEVSGSRLTVTKI